MILHLQAAFVPSHKKGFFTMENVLFVKLQLPIFQILMFVYLAIMLKDFIKEQLNAFTVQELHMQLERLLPMDAPVSQIFIGIKSQLNANVITQWDSLLFLQEFALIATKYKILFFLPLKLNADAVRAMSGIALKKFVNAI